MMISFRLTGQDLEWLQSQQIDSDLNQMGELSLAVTAKRILLSSSTASNNTVVTSVDTPVDVEELEQRLEEKMNQRFEEMYEQFANNLNYILDKRFEELEQSEQLQELQEPQELEQSKKPNLRSKTLPQLKIIAKNLGISYTSKVSKARLIRLIETDNRT